MAAKDLPIIVILGPTASGKTGLSLQIARELGNTEIICADSRTIYKGMDIGTAKPSSDERSVAPHHFLDILEPNQKYSAAEFQKSAKELIVEIKAANKIPILVGGSGLYIFSLIYDYSFPAGSATARREELEKKDIYELRSILQYLDFEAFSSVDIDNPRRVIRAIETAGMPKQKTTKLIDNVCLIGLKPELSELESRIKKRTQEMFDHGLINEVKELIAKYGRDIEAFQTVDYKEVIDFIDDKQDLQKTIELMNLHTRQLAKRQMTWFKRSKDIAWVNNYSEAIKEVNKFTQI